MPYFLRYFDLYSVELLILTSSIFRIRLDLGRLFEALFGGGFHEIFSWILLVASEEYHVSHRLANFV